MSADPQTTADISQANAASDSKLDDDPGIIGEAALGGAHYAFHGASAAVQTIQRVVRGFNARRRMVALVDAMHAHSHRFHRMRNTPPADFLTERELFMRMPKLVKVGIVIAKDPRRLESAARPWDVQRFGRSNAVGQVRTAVQLMERHRQGPQVGGRTDVACHCVPASSSAATSQSVL